MQTILLADEDDNFRRLISRVLSDQGFKVMEANPEEALAEVEHCRCPIDLLCGNAALARVGGVTLAERLKRNHPEMKVLLIIPEKRYFHVRKGNHAVAESHPEYAWMERPFTLSSLMARVRELLAPSQIQAAQS